MTVELLGITTVLRWPTAPTTSPRNSAPLHRRCDRCRAGLSPGPAPSAGYHLLTHGATAKAGNCSWVAATVHP